MHFSAPDPITQSHYHSNPSRLTETTTQLVAQKILLPWNHKSQLPDRTTHGARRPVFRSVFVG